MSGPDPEVQFISELIDRLEDEYAIDASRIYADGLSAGGSVAIVLACHLSDRIAAIGTVMAPHVVDEWCDDPEPVPLIAFNGTADPLLPSEGGTSWAIDEPMQSVADWIANWAMRNKCARPPMETREAEHVLRLDYESCAEDLVHYTLEGGGHQWPGGMSLPEFMAGPAIDTIDATGTLWRFFSKQRLQDE